jgi:hypothetical protein
MRYSQILIFRCRHFDLFSPPPHSDLLIYLSFLSTVTDFVLLDQARDGITGSDPSYATTALGPVLRTAVPDG